MAARVERRTSRGAEEAPVGALQEAWHRGRDRGRDGGRGKDADKGGRRKGHRSPNGVARAIDKTM